MTATAGHHTAMPPTRHLVLATLGPAVAWTVHLLAAYVVVAAWCTAGWSGTAAVIAALTVACAVASLAAGVLAWRVWRRGQAALRTDEEPGEPGPWDARMGERGARVAFIGVVGLFMAGIFTYLIVLEALPLLFTPICPAGVIS